MRRLTRRRAVPYKSPRLFSMLALLVCLVLMMNSLRNMRGPSQNARRLEPLLLHSQRSERVYRLRERRRQSSAASLDQLSAKQQHLR